MRMTLVYSWRLQIWCVPKFRIPCLKQKIITYQNLVFQVAGTLRADLRIHNLLTPVSMKQNEM